MSANISAAAERIATDDALIGRMADAAGDPLAMACVMIHEFPGHTYDEIVAALELAESVLAMDRAEQRAGAQL